MSDRGTDADLAREVGTLIRTLEDLQTELEPGDRRRLRLPTPGELLRLTSEVTIPAAIIVLETNVRVLRLLQRTIRMRTGTGDGAEGDRSAVRDRAESLGRETLRGLDATLAELQTALAGRPRESEAATLLAEARRLQDEVDDRLAGEGTSPGLDRDLDAGGADPVDVDVEAELRSIRSEIDDADGGGGGGGDQDGGDAGDEGGGDGNQGGTDTDRGDEGSGR